MGIPAEKKGVLLAYCRIDEPDAGELAVLDLLYDSAVEYMSNAGVAAPTAGTPRAAQYDLIVNTLVLDAYDQRGSQTTGAAITENPAFRKMLNQLKLTEPVSELDTGV